ncbi:MAG TPA: glycosyltransferase family 39 protein [Terriglobales bacterium]
MKKASQHHLSANIAGAAAARLKTSEIVFVAALLTLMAALSLASICRESITYDEVAHIPSGLSYWQQHDTRLNAEHPPLLKMIAAIPLLFTGARADYSDPSWCGSGGLECQWEFGKKFFQVWNRDAFQKIVLLARLPMAGLMLLLGWTIYKLARALAGPRGAAVSLTAFATSPFYLGYGPLVITDIGLCLFVLLSAWTLASLWQRPGLRKLFAFAFSTAGALLTKFSGLLVLPALLLFVLWMWWRRPSSGPLRPRVGYMAGGVFLAAFLSYIFYWLTCFRSSPAELANLRFHAITNYRAPERVLLFTTKFLNAHPGWTKPLQPLWLYLTGIGYLNAGLSRPTYLLGVHHWHGVWYYFPTVMLFKLSPGMLLLLALLIALAILRGRRKTLDLPAGENNRAHFAALISYLIVFSAAAMRSRLNIGIRHFSIPITILVVLIAYVVPLAASLLAPRINRLAQAAVALLAASCIVSALLAYPYYISYYNCFRMDTPKQEIVAESNLDWGQSLPAVAEFAAKHGAHPVYMDTMSPLDPDAYVPGSVPWQCDDPAPSAPEWAAVSADYLLKRPPTCIGLMRYQHWQVAGGSMYVFRITDSSYAVEEENWRKQHPNLTVRPATLKAIDAPSPKQP